MIGEAPADCSDGEDNDHDGFEDCRDPDCKALSECGGTARGRDEPPPPTGGQIGDAYVAEPPTDARVSEPPDPPDAAPIEPPDAAPPADAQTDEPVAPDCIMTGCPEGQTCADGRVCVDNELVVFDLWEVTQVDVYAPRSVEEGGSPCLDTACIPFARPPFPACGCEPDPQVQFWVDNPTDTMEPELAGETRVAPSRDEATWLMPGITLRLLPVSEIEVKLVDDDIEVNQPMFGCTIAAGVVTEGGPMECTAQFPLGDDNPEEFYIRVQVAPKQLMPPPG